jgi:L-malate glycosyltransferase
LREKFHVLVIPSEEYVPDYAPLAGIFQRHQITALRSNSTCHVGVLSIRLECSILMIIKAVLLRMIGMQVENDLRGRTVNELLWLLYSKLFEPEKFITPDKVDDVDVVRIKGFYYLPPSPNTDYYGWIKCGQVAFRKYVEKYGRPDIIHAHNAMNAGLLAQVLKKHFNIPYILTEHSSYYYQDLVPVKLYKRISEAIENAAEYLVVSPRLGQILVEKLGEVASRASWVPNVMPPFFEFDSAVLSKENKENNVFTFLSVGNLLPIKGHEFLIRAVAEICATNNNVSLRIIGDGPLRPDLEALVLALSIETQVVFLGEVDSKIIKSEMLNADALVLPSLFETFGVVLIEAMACGLPVISSACGGPEVIIDEGSGILVEPGDISALVRGLNWALKNVRKMDPAKIRESAIERFGGSQFSQKITEIYTRTLSR